jgi:HlyD family secretion protein
VASAVASGSSSAGPAHSWSGAPSGSGRERRARPGGSAAAAGAPPGEGGTERRTIYVMRNGVPEAVRLTTGLSDGTVTEVVKGDLKVGDEVVTDVVISGKPAAPAAGGGGAPGGAPRMGRMF